MSDFRLELKPRTGLDLLDASVRLYRRHFGPLLGISSVLLVPFGVTYTLGMFFYYLAMGPFLTTGEMPANFRGDVPMLILGLALLILGLSIMAVLGPLSQGALALAISEQYLGRTLGVLEAYRRVRRYWWPLFLVGLVFGLLGSIGPVAGGVLGAGAGLALSGAATPVGAIVGGALGLVAGLPVAALFFTWFVFYEQTLVLEQVRGLDSLQRSRSLVTGQGWRVFGILLLTGIGTSIATAVLAAPVSVTVSVIAGFRPEFLPYAQLLSQCAQQIVSVFLGPVFMIVQTLVYYDLRIRKEGFDLATMAAGLESLRPVPVPAELSPPASGDPQ
jgi:MFS family permease